MTDVEDLRNWSLGLIVLGFIHLVSGFLDPVWGVYLVLLGVVVLKYQHRWMYLVIGISLFYVGIMNSIGGIQNSGASFWVLIGLAQMYWGLKEISKIRNPVTIPEEIQEA